MFHSSGVDRRLFVARFMLAAHRRTSDKNLYMFFVYETIHRSLVTNLSLIDGSLTSIAKLQNFCSEPIHI